MYKEEKKPEQSLNVPIMQFFEMKKAPFPQSLYTKTLVNTRFEKITN